MVAFIGAVICIIAAVHTGSSRAVAAPHQPAADNQSLYPHTPAAAQTPGARPGPLGALHGSETPTTFTGGQSGLDGLTGHDPAVSRLVCTPIPAGECNPKNFQQQADEPSVSAAARSEDWGFLRSAAEELRQTVLQQKEQILSEQRTITELTGKLSECERGLDRRGSAAGLWGGRAERRRYDRVMVRDSPASDSPDPDGTAHLTVRAVNELEEAITQLKNRIEKLESDIGSFPLNQTDADTSRAPGAGGLSDGAWRVEDLEGELERKVELLEKERKALRLETQRHRQEIDRGINKLHHRLSGLEEGVSGHSFPEGYRLSFPTRTDYMHAVVTHAVPELRAISVCLWLRLAEGGVGTPLSYAVLDQPNELVLLLGLHTPAQLIVNDKVAQLPLNLSRGSWQHMCVTWSQKGGAWHAYQGGKLRGEGHGLAPGHHIRPAGVLVLGQEQDSLGGGFDSAQALVGELSQVALWDRVLTPSQVASLARCGRVTQGSVAPWTEKGVEVSGGATKDPGEPCSKHSRNSQ